MQCLPDPTLQRLPLDTTTRRPPLQPAEFFSGLAQRHRDAPLLPAQQFLTLHHHQGAIQFPDLGPQPRRAHVAQLPSYSLHRSSSRPMLQGQLRGAMAQGQRDQGEVAFYVQIELQLFTPRTAVPHQCAAGGRAALLGIVQGIVKPAQGIQARVQH